MKYKLKYLNLKKIQKMRFAERDQNDLVDVLRLKRENFIFADENSSKN